MSIVIEHKDAYEFLASLPSKSVQLIYSDPPYNTTQNEWEEAMKWEQFWKECNRILKDDGAIVLHSMQPFTTQMISSN
jgi:site-specific DNA-methyltransferase (adenine-specific)